TVKAGLIVAKLSKNMDELEKVLDNYPFWTGAGNKINWSVCVLDKDKEMEIFLKNYFKKRFKAEKLKAIWKPAPRPWELAAWKAGLEIVSFFDGKEMCIGKTLTVFNPRAVARRDLGRPEQKPEIAISLRLARILINLSGAKAGAMLLDPFCGIGTILQEALLAGIRAAGIDIDPANIAMAKRNLEWFTKKYDIATEWSVNVGNATELPEMFERNSVNAIATEPYLGPLLKARPTEAEAKRIISELNLLYKDFLMAAHAVLAPGGRIASVFPCFKTDNALIEIPVADIAQKIGFKLWQPTKKTFPYLYTDERKKIDRLIYVLVKS
ncbi:MAG: hypothetical protein KQA33_03295, partial [Candidatus Aenigmarchaeota archaeon]|nr:hypothetical protein [Candidatus Aenigmarchaeota archaeon]